MMNGFPNIRTALLLLIGVVLLSGAGQALGEAKKKKQPPRTRPVVVAEIKSVSESTTFKASGLLSPVDKALLSVEVSGKVTAIRRRVGDHVRKGQLLAELSNSNLTLEKLVLKAKVKEAEAELALSRQKLRRTEALFKRNLASAEQFENERAASEVMVARHASALAQLKRIETQLEMMVVRAPIAGQVIKADLEIGQWINSTRPIYEIYSFDRFELLVGVPGRFMNRMNRKAPVTVRISEIGKKLKGKIQSVVRHVNSASGNFLLRIEVANPRRIPLSGLVAQIDVPVGGRGRVLTVPRDAIVRRNGKTQVAVVRKGRAHVVPVTVRANVNQTDVVIEGKLKPKERVVVRGNERLFTGMPVRITGKL